MPTLKQITCTVECSGSNTPLKEYQTIYGDGYVQTFVAVPSISTPFSVHLKSKGYIAPGLAMFVYMDGEYQCNRNRHNLKIPNDTTTSRQTEVDFRVRQKEEIQPDGTFAGCQWKFRELDIVPSAHAGAGNSAPYNIEHIGTIEVLVLRCYPVAESVKSGPSQPVPIRKNLQQSKAKQRVPTPVPSPLTSSNDDSSSDEDDSPSALGGLFDGTSDRPRNHSSFMAFGGDASWDNSGQGWDNEGQNSWQQQSNSQSWNDVPATNNAPANGQGQWDNQSSHAPSVRQSKSQGNNGSKRSRRSSVTEEIPHVPSPRDAWGSQQALQPSTPSPAVVVNVIQPGATFVPSSAQPGWSFQGTPGGIQPPNSKALPPPVDNQSPNSSSSSGSKQSGSGSDASNNNGAANNSNPNDNWQDATSGAQDWAINPPSAPKIPGTWEGADSRPQENTQWNDNSNGNNGWPASNNLPQGSQTGNSQSGWNNGVSNGGGNNNQSSANGLAQQNGWDRGAAGGNGNWNNNNAPPQQNAVSNPQQQSAWNNDNFDKKANSNETTQWNQNQSGQGHNGNHDASVQTWNGFDNHQPIAEASKREQSVKSNQSIKQSGPIQDFAPSATAALPIFNPYLAQGPSMLMPLQPKSYWSIWKAGPEPEEQAPVPEPEVEEGPVYRVPKEIAQRQMMSHQVLLGKPTTYLHKMSKPKYMDTHENPYAAFIFHYRSKEVLEQMLGTKLSGEEEEEKERLGVLSKEELIEQLLKAKSSAGSQKISSSTTDSSSFKGSKNSVVGNATGRRGSGLDFGGLLANKLSRLATKDEASSEKPMTNLDTLWGPPVAQGLGISSGPDASINDHVAGWLNNGGGGNVGNPVAGPPQAAWPPANGGGQMNSPVASQPQNNWNANNGGGYNMSGGNGEGQWRTESVGQMPPAVTPWVAGSHGSAANGNGPNPSANGSRKGSGSVSNNIGLGSHGAAWNNGGGHGNGSQNGGGWNNGNGGQSGSYKGGSNNNNEQTGGNAAAAPASGW